MPGPRQVLNTYLLNKLVEDKVSVGTLTLKTMSACGIGKSEHLNRIYREKKGKLYTRLMKQRMDWITQPIDNRQIGSKK